MTITRHYAYVGDRRVHYRRAGSGPPMVLLHSCPGSSYSVESLIAPLAEWFTVIALDTPGYGESEGLGLSLPSITDYRRALAATLDTLGLGSVLLYGYRTGAKIALDFALASPGRVSRLVLEGLAEYTPEERNAMFAGYTPDLTPRWDGTHILSAWAWWRDVCTWWPWFQKTGNARIPRPLPDAEVLHGQIVDLLRAGKDYWQGYHAAFSYDASPALRSLTAPTLIFATGNDPFREHLDRLGDLPANITREVVEAGVSPRQAAADRAASFSAGSGLASAPPPSPAVWSATTVRREYARTSIGELMVRMSGTPGSGQPLIVLPSLPSSSIPMEPLVLAMGRSRPTITFDLPGSGDSAAVPGHPTIADLGDVILQGIDSLGIQGFDLYGTHTGAFIAMDLAARYPDRIRRFILDNFPVYTAEEAQDRLDNNFPPFIPRTDGGHLLELWHIRRDNMIWSPWYRRTPSHARHTPLPGAEALHLNYVETLKGALTSHAAHEAAFRFSVPDEVKKIAVPTLVTLAANDDHADRVRDAAATMRNAVVEARPAALEALFQAFLDA